MFSAWFIMLTLGNIGHQFDNPKLFVSYWFCIPIGIIFDAVLTARSIYFRK